MSEVIRMFFGIPPSSELKAKKFEIEPNMINPDVVRMNMTSFRKSDAVKKQAAAALEVLLWTKRYGS